LNSAAHVRASTMPVTDSECSRWKRSTAPCVIGPKMPSAVTPTWRWVAETAGPTSPKRSNCTRPPVAAASDEVSSATSARPPADRAPPFPRDPAKAGITGAASIAAPTASDVPLRRWRSLRPAASSRRRCRERSSDWSHNSSAARSRPARGYGSRSEGLGSTTYVSLLPLGLRGELTGSRAEVALRRTRGDSPQRPRTAASVPPPGTP
jgi:hypothetical protein